MNEQIRLANSSLSLQLAERIIDAALETKRSYERRPLAVVVLDGGSNLVAFKREDGCANLRFEIARGKAAAALGMGMSSRAIRDRLHDRPAFQASIAAASHGQFTPAPGGVLILDADGVAIGAVGISGDTSDKDEFCAITGVNKSGLSSEPAKPVSDWNQSHL